MNRHRLGIRRSACGVLVALVVASCYRAEIEIALLPGPPDAAAGASAGERGRAGGEANATAGAGGSGASPSNASAGRSETAGGTASIAGLGGAAAGRDEPRETAGDSGDAGAAGAANCSLDPLPDVQAQCRLRLPSRATCSTQVATGWNGCGHGGCNVCDDMLVDFPYYFRWHPCCIPNSSCVGGLRVKCNERCPPPTPHDRIAPCGARIRLID